MLLSEVEKGGGQVLVEAAGGLGRSKDDGLK